MFRFLSRRPAARPRLTLESLSERDVPAFLTSAEVVVGTDAGAPPLVRVLDPSTQTEITQFLAFDSGFYGGVRVAVGDITGDGYPDLVAAAGPGGGPAVKVFDGQSGSLVMSFMAFPTNFSGGVNIAIGDVTGDGRNDIVAGAGAGGGPAVTVFSGTTGSQVASFFAYASNFEGGVRVATADTNGDGVAEVITVPGYSGGPDMRFYSVNFTGSATQVGGFASFDPNFTGGGYVAAADLTGDGVSELVIGAGPGGSPRVAVYTPSGVSLASFYAYGNDFLGGVRVGTADLTGDGTAELLTAPGPTGSAQINVYQIPNTTSPSSLYGFPTNQSTGFFVSGSSQPLNIPATPTDQITAAYQQLQNVSNPNQTTLVPVGVPYPTGYYPFGYYPYGFYYPYYYDAFGLYSPIGYYYGSGFFLSTALAAPVSSYGVASASDPYGLYSSPGYSTAGYGMSGYYPSGSYYSPAYTGSYYYAPSYADTGAYYGGFSDVGSFYGGDFGGGDFFF